MVATLVDEPGSGDQSEAKLLAQRLLKYLSDKVLILHFVMTKRVEENVLNLSKREAAYARLVRAKSHR